MLRNKLYAYGEESLKVPHHLHFGKEMLDRMVLFKDQPAVIDVDNKITMTFGQLAQQTVDIALSLARLGVGKGDVVSVCSERKMEILPTVIATICLGAAYSPTEISYGSVPLQHRIKIAKPKVMFMSQSTYAQHKEAFDTVGCIQKYIIYNEIQNGVENQNGHEKQNGGEHKDDVIMFKDFLTETAEVSDFLPTEVDGREARAFILFSSGTTGLPKGVPVTHMAALMNSVSLSHDSFTGSSILITPEWYLSFGIYITINCLWRGITCVFTDIEREHDYLQAVQQYKVKILFLVPCLINFLAKSQVLDQYDTSSIEAILTTSSPLTKEEVQAVKTRVPSLREVYQFYGMTEAGPICSNLWAPQGPRDGSVGVPVHGYVIKVVDSETRKPLGPHQRGEICLKSPTIVRGYIGVDHSEYIDPEGFYKTGDVGYYDEDKYFYVVNRIKDLIKYDDYSIAPAEMEALLCTHAGVVEAGVASVRGLPAALVVPQPGAQPAPHELADYLHNMVTFFRLEGGVYFAEKLPRGAGNKLNRRALQQQLEDIMQKS